MKKENVLNIVKKIAHININIMDNVLKNAQIIQFMKKMNLYVKMQIYINAF